MLREVTAIIRASRWRATLEALLNAGIPAFTRQRVYGRGRQRGLRYGSEPGSGGIPVLPKWMLTLVLEDGQVDAAVEAIVASNCTGEIGDGKIFVGQLGGALRLSDLKLNAEALDLSLPRRAEADT